MKKIAILGSDRADLFECIYNYFKNKDINFTVVTDKINSELIDSAKKLGVEYRHVPVEENVEFFGARSFDLIVIADYKPTLSEEVIELGKFINVHPSLLPSFKGEDAIYRAFVSGVKVSGVTVHWVTNEPDGGKILAQYPVLINNTTHFDEFKQEIYSLENILYPKVIDAILNDKVFDFSDLFDSGKCGSGSCGNCNSHCNDNSSEKS